jgi:hypothetical protein
MSYDIGVGNPFNAFTRFYAAESCGDTLKLGDWKKSKSSYADAQSIAVMCRVGSLSARSPSAAARMGRLAAAGEVEGTHAGDCRVKSNVE